ncbi:hypothetical protein KIL84_009083 [Mauremys mutica]|uniref:Secreted protein n=1 Tax=Mauremys mutica TaxID=74926 RepID=A0A9D3XHW8_9SAUR|nr:hypothetical protein KIL84_009083 [Mauremys mutica]
MAFPVRASQYFPVLMPLLLCQACTNSHAAPKNFLNNSRNFNPFTAGSPSFLLSSCCSINIPWDYLDSGMHFPICSGTQQVPPIRYLWNVWLHRNKLKSITGVWCMCIHEDNERATCATPTGMRMPENLVCKTAFVCTCKMQGSACAHMQTPHIAMPANIELLGNMHK